jgi:hypothetical protein
VAGALGVKRTWRRGNRSGGMSEITVLVSDLEPVRAILGAAGDLAKRVDWFLNDMAHTKPEDFERMSRGFIALNDQVVEFKRTVQEHTGERL